MHFAGDSDRMGGKISVAGFELERVNNEKLGSIVPPPFPSVTSEARGEVISTGPSSVA